MPIITTSTQTAPPQAPTVFAPPVPRPVSTWLWHTPSGVVRDLTNGDIYLRPGGITGHLAAPQALIESLPPTIDGGVYRGTNINVRDIGMALLAVGDAGTWTTMQRQLVADFDTRNGDGILEVAHPDGERRMLTCRYNSGLEGPDGGDPGAVYVAPFTIQLRAHDPWWYGPVMSLPWQFTAPEPFIPASGAPPFYIAPVRAGGAVVAVVNPGDVPAYPVWTLTGPLTAVTVTEHVSARSWAVSADLGVGEQITVDTDPRVPAPQKITQAGVNVWGVLTGDYPDLWPLPAGECGVSVSVTGSTSTTRVMLQFNPRFRTA